jgi:nitrogenase-stabilizing/protective protein
MMNISDMYLDEEDLSSAEDFLDYFGITYDASVVQVNRLHILQRFHDYLDGVDHLPADRQEQHRLFAGLLQGAYQDFVVSDARTEKVFRVFHMHQPQTVSIPLASLQAGTLAGAPEV